MHSPTPWHAVHANTPRRYRVNINPHEGTTLFSLSGPYHAGARILADATRIVACVNACEGLNPDKLPEAVASLRAYLKASPKGAYDSGRLDAAFAALTEGE